LEKEMITCQFEDGGSTNNLRHVSATSVGIKGNQILLVKRSPSMILYPSTWVNPGGFLNKGETTAQGALRELVEETGYAGKVIELLRANDDPNRPDGTRQTVDFVYLVEVTEKVGDGDNESTEVKWFDLDKLPPESEFGFDHYESVQLYLTKAHSSR
jgi:ADP-ribose pyrophosphatase YjhB (NUDIX family)